MAGSMMGRIFRFSSFGESHGPAVGGVVDGCPAGTPLDLSAIQGQLDRRKPGQSSIVTQRKEADKVRFLSGLFEGKTTGTPIGFIVENGDQRSSDYEHLKEVFRPSHADYTYQKKYGIRDYRGGGRSSARETVARVIAGAIARQVIPEVKISAYVSSVGDITLPQSYQELDLSQIEKGVVRCPDPIYSDRMEALIRKVKKEGDTIGGVVSCVIQGVPIGLGEPVFDKIHADLGKAMLSINAVKGFEYGSGFSGTKMKGSEHNDLFGEGGLTETNLSGGVQGGITNGMDIYFRVAFKPVATIMRAQDSIDIKGQPVSVLGRGRHDPCVVPRAVPIVEAMAALVMVDHFLMMKSKSTGNL